CTSASFPDVTAAAEHDPLSLHDALPISASPKVVAAASACRSPASSSRRTAGGSTCNRRRDRAPRRRSRCHDPRAARSRGDGGFRSEEHTSELQSRENLVCRLLLEKKKTK